MWGIGRMFVCLLSAAPSYLTAQTVGVAGPAVTQPGFTPMTEGERSRDYVKSLFSPTSLLSAGASAGIGQWEDRPKEWKQGAKGYGRRFGSSFAEHIVRETVVFGVSSAFREDNRYLASGKQGFGARVRYAAESTFLTRRADGARHLSISRMVGFAGASLLSRFWQPPSTSSTRTAALNFGTSLGVSVGFNVAREFLPAIFHTRGLP